MRTTTNATSPWLYVILGLAATAPGLASGCLVDDTGEVDPAPPSVPASRAGHAEPPISDLPDDLGVARVGLGPAKPFLPPIEAAGPEDCKPGFEPYDAASIPVWVHNDVPGVLRHADDAAPNGQGAFWTRSELEKLMLRIVSIINETNGSAHPPLYFAGWTWDEGLEENAIKVRVQRTSCQWSGNGGRSGGEVNIPTWACGSYPTLELFDLDFGNQHFVGSGGFLLHEFAHALGIAHDRDGTCRPQCASRICSLGDADASKQEHSSFFWDDQEFFRYHYGDYAGDTEHLESADAASWWALGGSTPPLRQPGAELSGNGEIGPYMFLNGRSGDGAQTLQSRWVSGTETWEPWAQSAVQGSGAVGSAYDASTGRVFAVRLSNETSQTTNKRLQWATVPGPYTTDTSGIETERHGVSAAYDPRSELLVAVTRAQKVTNATAHWQIQFHLIDPETNQVVKTSTLGTYDDPVLAFDTPSVTCGRESIYFNCMIAWGTGGDPEHYPGLNYHVLRTMQFRVTKIINNWVIWKASYQSPAPNGSNWIAYSRPVVTYKGGGQSGSQFVLAWSVPRVGQVASSQYTVTKSGDETAPWGSLAYHYPNGKYRHQPVLGAQNGYVELLRPWKP